MGVDENGNPIPEPTQQTEQPQSEQQAAVQLPPAVEQRIAEITRAAADERRENQARIDALIQQNAELMRTFAERQAQQPDPYAPLPDELPLDPSVERQMKRLFTPQLAQLQATIERQNAYIQQLSFRQFEGQHPPEVIDHARGLMQAWQKGGKTGWVEQDAIDFAYVQLQRRDQHARVQEQGNRFGRPAPQQQYRPQYDTMQYGAAPPNPAPPVPVQRFAAPKNFDRMSLDERLAAYAQSGIGDEPL